MIRLLRLIRWWWWYLMESPPFFKIYLHPGRNVDDARRIYRAAKTEWEAKQPPQ